MASNKIKKHDKLIFWSLIFTTLAITPFFSYDPINIIKLVFLSFFGLIAFFLVIFNSKILKSFLGRKLVVIYFFIFWLITSLFFSGFGILEGFFGVAGRQTGVLAYLALASLFLFVILTGTRELFERIIKVVWITSVASIIYGVIQAFGADPFNWVNPYSPVFGFFGNPNFQSSFIAMTAAAVSGYTLYENSTMKVRISGILVLLISTVIIFETESKQGYLVLFAGLAVMSYLWIRSNERIRKFSSLFLSFQVFTIIIVLLDIFQKTPWRSILYEESISIRGDLWRAAWRMTIDHPLTGVGIDGYRDSYRLFRDEVTAGRTSGYATVESAHNVFLDIASGGGLPLLLAYLLIMIVVIRSSTIVVKRNSSFRPSFCWTFIGLGVLSSTVSYLNKSNRFSNLGVGIFRCINFI